MKFHITEWKHPLCLHIEIYGQENAEEISTEVLRENSGSSPPIFQELFVDHERREDTQELTKGNYYARFLLGIFVVVMYGDGDCSYHEGVGTMMVLKMVIISMVMW